VHWVLRRAAELRGDPGPYVPVGNPPADPTRGEGLPASADEGN